MASQTAYGNYSYSRVYRGKELRNWVAEVHKKNCGAMGWRHTPLKPGAFGFDNLAVCIAKVLESDCMLLEENLEGVADAVHQAWIENYTYWRDNQPWKGGVYIKPAKTLGDKEREMCVAKRKR